MKKILFAFVIMTCFASCDDGDIIVTSFDFEDQTLERCSDFEAQLVFFKINPANNESIALVFTTSNDIFSAGNGQEESRTLDVQLSGNDNITYRRFDAAPTNNYFCNPIPPASPLVVEEFISTSGMVRIITEGTFGDNDGISSDIEDPTGLVDTDGDSLPDIIDFDDDGDNVPTVQEGVSLNSDGTINTELTRDTDGDGIFDYLDNDDDNDGVLTIDEDANMDLNPRNDNSDPTNEILDYLNPMIAVSVNTQSFRLHTYFLNDIIIIINTQNLDFRNQNGEEVIRDIRSVPFGTFEGTPDATFTITPDF